MVVRFIFLTHENKIYISDVFIACAAKISGCEKILAFDKKTSQFEFFESIAC
jgi:predicted nucleic-acid-binding protein